MKILLLNVKELSTKEIRAINGGSPFISFNGLSFEKSEVEAFFNGVTVGVTLSFFILISAIIFGLCLSRRYNID